MPSAVRSSLSHTLLAAVLLAVPAAPAVRAQDAAPVPGIAPQSGLPVPRFVTLRSEEVNVRTGPGTRYPVEWVFVRKNIPVEITAEFDTWRRIRDWEGAEGWVHQSMLSGRRAVVVTGDVRSLRRSPNPGSPAVARLEPGVVGQLGRCDGDWCQVEVSGYGGWMARHELWGVYPTERVD